MKIEPDKFIEIVTEIGVKFRTFGGGIANNNNPVSVALADKPLMFAAGVPVAEVVAQIISML